MNLLFLVGLTVLFYPYNDFQYNYNFFFVYNYQKGKENSKNNPILGVDGITNPNFCSVQVHRISFGNLSLSLSSP